MQLPVLNGLERFLLDLSQNRFYGTVQLQFVDGELVVIRKEETIKPNLLVIVE